MPTMNISLPDALKDHVEAQVAGGQYGTSSEYLRELIRADMARLNLRQWLLDGLESPEGEWFTPDSWARLGADARA